MFFRKFSSFQPSLSLLKNLHSEAPKSLLFQPAFPFSFFRSSSDPYKNLVFHPEFSFASAFKSSLQARCLDDLSTLEGTIDPDQMSYFHTNLQKYAFCQDPSQLSIEDAHRIGTIFRDLAQLYEMNSQPLKAVEYLEEKAILLDITEGNSVKNYIDILLRRWTLGKRDDLKARFEKAQRAFIKKFVEDPDDPNINDLQLAFTVGKAFLCRHEGKDDEALQLLKETSTELSMYHNPDYIVYLPKIYREMAEIYFSRRQNEEAIDCCKKAVAASLSVYPNNPRKRALTYFKIAGMMFENSESNKALFYSIQALNIFRKLKTKSLYEVAANQYQLGGIYYVLGEWKNARRFYQGALKDFEVHFQMKDGLNQDKYYYMNPDQQFDLKRYINYEIAKCYFFEHDFENAFATFEQCRELLSSEYGEESPEVAMLLLEWGRILKKKKETRPEALRFFEEALKMFRQEAQRGIPLDYGVEATLMNHLGETLYLEGKYPEAIKVFEENQAFIDKAIQRWIPKEYFINPLAILYIYRGLIFFRSGETDKGLELFMRVKEMAGVKKSILANSLYHIGCVYEKKNEPEKAISFLEDSFDIYMKTYGSEYPQTRMCAEFLFGFLRRNEREDKEMEIKGKYGLVNA